MLGVTDDTERQKIINWARGQDIDDEQTADGVTPTSTTSTAMRPSVHGDVVHSRPVAINFGTDSSPQVVVFYAANDGVFRAINGNRPGSQQQLMARSTACPRRRAVGLRAAGVPQTVQASPRERHSGQLPHCDHRLAGAEALCDGRCHHRLSRRLQSQRDRDHAAGRPRRSMRSTRMQAIRAISSSAWKVGCNDSQCTGSDFNEIGQTWSPVKVVYRERLQRGRRAPAVADHGRRLRRLRRQQADIRVRRAAKVTRCMCSMQPRALSSAASTPNAA